MARFVFQVAAAVQCGEGAVEEGVEGAVRRGALKCVLENTKMFSAFRVINT